MIPQKDKSCIQSFLPQSAMPCEKESAERHVRYCGAQNPLKELAQEGNDPIHE